MPTFVQLESASDLISPPSVSNQTRFVQLVREELLGTRVFVFTRNGRILNLARGATLADAAEQLHASLRNHIALVNGNLKSGSRLHRAGGRS